MARLPGFGERLRSALREVGMNQLALATKVGKAPSSVTRWLRGEIPEIRTLRLVASAVRQPMAYLILGEDALREASDLAQIAQMARARKELDARNVSNSTTERPSINASAVKGVGPLPPAVGDRPRTTIGRRPPTGRQRKHSA